MGGDSDRLRGKEDAISTQQDLLYRVVVVGGRRKPQAGTFVSSKRNSSGGWDAVYVTGRENLKMILLQSKGATQVQVREADPVPAREVFA